MCGVCGIVSKAPLPPEAAEAVRRMNVRMVHRGPDGAGEFSDGDSGHLFMAMRRLSIIDLHGGWQPLHNEAHTVSLLVNGEIYNFVELRRELEAAGHRFRTRSDGETLVHLYEDHRLDFVHKLRGMFAFALWDATRRLLVLGRDRMGEKPLYLFESDNTILFASELKALVASGRVPFTLDPAAVHEYLHYGWVPEPRTILKGVRKLPPGYLLTVDVANWAIEERPYWRLLDAPPVEGDAEALIRSELETLAEQIIRSDVPVGVALSGGIDSSVIAALAAKKCPGAIQAFSVGYSGTPHQDERRVAGALAKQLRIPFHEIEISVREMVDGFPALNLARDEPIADIAGHCYHALSRNARLHGCPVLLQGQGGDELFWGYTWVVRAVESTTLRMRGEAPDFFQALRAELPRGVSLIDIRRFLSLGAGLVAGWKHLRPWTSAPSDQLVFYDLNDSYQMGAFGATKTYTRRFRDELGDYSAARLFNIPRPWDRPDLLIFDLLAKSYLLQNGLGQGDRLSMANSVEARLPLVDYRLVELVVGLQKWRPSFRLPEKAVLKAAARGLVPEAILNRQKRGFNPPGAAWLAGLKAKHARSLVGGYMVSSRVLSAEAAQFLCHPHSRFGAWNDLTFKYLVLESWCRGFRELAIESGAPVAGG
ncbi:MAG: asparagine synthase (glutamine-hydrolyzing) [Polyangiaceae bacterium]|nr:asparagine synthase (glutamine-hydrolyzing) [Polyangiaceae bacterium]